MLVAYDFPRMDWTGVRFGFPLYGPGEHAHELACAARTASLAGAQAIAVQDGRQIVAVCEARRTGQGQRDVSAPPPCLHALTIGSNLGYQVERSDTPLPERPIMAFADWVDDMEELI